MPWWLLGFSPGGIFFWRPAGWTAEYVTAYQGPLFPLASFSSPDIRLASFPTGIYHLIFAVDLNPDGVFSWNHLFWDDIVVEVTD